jgi:hypothetical protein
MNPATRRQFLKRLGLSAAALPFLPALSSLRAAGPGSATPQRVIFMFSPNGIVPPDFWPDTTGPDFKLKPILAALEPWKNRLLTLKGINNKVRGDGDGHMRGMSCLLTAIELFPGNIQGGGETPAGWASGISIDQELKNFLQSNPGTETRFGSLELGVAVPNRADPWTRWVYAGPNAPLAPLSSPYDVFEKLYGQTKDRESLGSVLDEVTEDLRVISAKVPAREKALLDQHVTFVRQMEQELQQSAAQKLRVAAPVIEAGLNLDNDGMPQVSPLQQDLLINAFANDLARIGSIQYTNSVGQARMKWLGINDDHHGLSHDPDLNAGSQEKLVRINQWFCGELASLAGKLEATPEPNGDGNMLDHTTIVWTNELGKGNSHSHEDIPFVLLGGGLGFKTGRALQFEAQAHNRLWLSLAHAMGHCIDTFGNKELSAGGSLVLS